MPDAKYLSINAKVILDEYVFSARGREVIFDGYTKISLQNAKKADEENLPSLQEGQVLKLVEVKNEKKFTKPPARFSEAALVKELESKGIGRPSTYCLLYTSPSPRD